MGDLKPRTLLHKRYEIMQTIGQGGMAAVYQARDTKHDTFCAIKEMSLSTVAPDERSQAIQNFLAEARILSRLNHPNLPAFTDFFTEDARHFLVMEYVDGSTLEDLLERNGRPFSERRVLGWARQLCDVLEYLHSQQPPVIFRDMRPGNVMVTPTGRIKLIDFGFARLHRKGASQDEQLLGTPGYAPPEQYGGAQTNERSDIYSLAMTLFQLMTCSISEKGFGLKNIHANFPFILPPVARALEKATSLGPEDRYESIVVFRRALLGIDTFRFENGGEATTPEELAELCARYPEEAGKYLFSGEIESWLQEIGANDLARTTKRIRVTVNDPSIAVNKFLQAILKLQTSSTNAAKAQQVARPPIQTMKVFYCYAREDKALRDELEKHLGNLKRQGRITGWHDRDINAGKEWEKEIDINLNTADIILLLISPDFIDSDYCYSIEMRRALERQYSGEARVIPIILRPVDWEEAPFSSLQVLPTDGKPVNSALWHNRDEAFFDIAKGIRKVVYELLASRC